MVPEQDTQQNQKTARELHSEIEYSGQADGPDHREHPRISEGNVGQVTVHHTPAISAEVRFAFSMAATGNAVGSGVGTERCRHGKAHDFPRLRGVRRAPSAAPARHASIGGPPLALHKRPQCPSTMADSRPVPAS